MFLGWVKLFFLTDFRNALFTAIETQIYNKKKIYIYIRFTTYFINIKYSFFNHKTNKLELLESLINFYKHSYEFFLIPFHISKEL